MRLVTFLILVPFLTAGFARAESSSCSDAGKIYRQCRDQKASLEEALAAARRDQKQLVVNLGADWCPWCRSLHGILGDQAFTAATGGEFQVAEVALYKEREKIPAGYSALEELMRMAGMKKKPKGIPALFVVNPARKTARYIDTGLLERNSATSKGHDPEKVYAAVSKAGRELK